MKQIFCGKNADGKPIYLTPEMRQYTHMHVIGGTRTGKSKFLEWLIRQDIDQGNGFCLVDWHGSLYHDVLAYCDYRHIGIPHYGVKDFRKVILIDPSKPDFVTGFNPFMNPGEDVSTQVNRRIDATVRPWGGTDTDDMPTFERMARILFTFMAETGQTLPNAAALLDPERRQVRDYAIRILEDDNTRSQLQRLQSIKTSREWEDKVLSMENRLSRFIGSLAIRRFMGLTDHNIDLLDIMDSGKILLVNLGESGYLDPKAAKVFASLLLYEFKATALQRVGRARGSSDKPSLYPLYLDEFQNYITDDIAGALDECLKGGLHMVLAHQHLGHFEEERKLQKSVFTNARIRAVFGGLDYEDSCMLANEMFLPDLNTRQIEKAYYHTIHVYEEETRNTRSHGRSRGTAASRGTSKTSGTSSGSGFSSGSSHMAGYNDSYSTSTPGSGAPPQLEGWSTESRGSGHSYADTYSDSYSDFSNASQSSGTSESTTASKAETEGETIVPVWVPMPRQELGSEVEASIDTKRNRIVQLLKESPQQHCYLKVDREKTQPLLVPFVKDCSVTEASLQKYQFDLFKAQGALPAAEVDRLVKESRQKFLTAAGGQVVDVTLAIEKPEGPHLTNPFDDMLKKT